MRTLGAVQSGLRAAIYLAAHDETGTSSTEPTIERSFTLWNVRDVQVMVLISLALQLFLLFAGNVRRRRRVGWLMFLVWLAYLAAYAVAVSAIGLFSQYEEKYKLRSRESFEHLHTLTMPFLWAPFLLLHLGGPDTITAFSIEDNNLWTRQLINLLFNLSLALYVFWKSFDLLDSKLLTVAVPLFAAGIIKYGERIWALKNGSRESLDCRPKKEDPKSPDELARDAALEPGTGAGPSAVVEASAGDDYVQKNHVEVESSPGDGGGAGSSAVVEVSAVNGDAVDTVEPTLESRVLKTALWCRGLIAGRTLVQLGSVAVTEVQDAFTDTDRTELKLKFILTELGMIYDMLYTKAMVLQSWTGVFRCAGLVTIVGAFVRFWVNQHLHAHRTVNSIITYILFTAAIYMEVYSIFMVIVSPWTRARSKPGMFLYSLSSKLYSLSRLGLSNQGKFPGLRSSNLSRQGLPSPSMGQFNLIDYCLSKKPTGLLVYMKKLAFKVSETVGLDNHWRNFWHVKHIEDEVILKYIVELFNTDPEYTGERRQLNFDNELKYLLKLPFEHTLFRLHIFTEMHLSKLDDDNFSQRSDDFSEWRDDMKVHAAECKKLSNYLMYLMAVYPSMLPVGSATQDLESLLVGWIRKNHGDGKKEAILKKYAKDKLYSENNILSPFNDQVSPKSLKDLKEVWARLLIYAAGKCRMELHARQLGEGMELLTVVGILMMHHNIGDVGRRLELLAPRRAHTQEAAAVVHENEEMDVVLPEEPLYAFDFVQPFPQEWYVRAWDRLDINRKQLDYTPISPLGTGGMETEEEAVERIIDKGKEIDQDVGKSGGQEIEVGESSQMSGQPFAVSSVVQPPQGQI